MSSSPSKRLKDLNPVQHDRLVYTDFRSYFSGEISRPDLVECFGMTPAGTTRDLALYREVMPHNITLDNSSRIYRIGQELSPLFEYASLRILSVLPLGFGDGVNDSIQALLPYESPTALSIPKMDVLAMIHRRIHAKQPVAIRCRSMSSDESKRVIAPLTLVDIGLCWRVRAFDRKSREFRDFVVTRIGEPALFDKEPQANERPYNDIQQTCIIELDSVPCPSVERPGAIEMNYGMTGGLTKVHVRAAVVGYALQR